MAVSIPPNDLLDLRVANQAVTFRFDLLDKDFNLTGEIHPARTVSIDNNTSAQIMRTIRGLELTEAEASDINIFADRVRPSMVLQDGTVWPMGVFHFTSDEHRVGTAQTPLASTLMDQAFSMNSPLPFSYGISNFGSIHDAMIEIILASGITRYSVDFTDAIVAGGPANWPPDTTALSILSSLAERARFLKPYFDNSGTLILRPADVVQAGVGHNYSTGVNSRVLVDTLSTSTNLLTAPNAYKVISSGATTSLVSATAFIDPSLPHSKENRGFIITDVYKVQGVGSQDDCRAIAEARAKQDPLQFSTAEFVSIIDPRHDSFDIVNINGTSYRETAWSAVLAPGGQHRHTLIQKVLADG